MEEEIQSIKEEDLKKALSEFETKGEYAPVEEKKIESPFKTYPKMVVWIFKASGGLLKNEKQAEYVLLVLVILMFALSFYFFFGNNLKQNDIPIELLPDQSQFVQ